MKLRQAAKACGVSYARLWGAVRRRELPAVRLTVRGNYHVDGQDVAAWLTRYRIPAEGSEPVTHAPRLGAPAMEATSTLADLLPPTAERRFS
jgi:hypothetical protein